MENTLPVSDLKNYNEVLKNCHKGEPLYLTEGGRVRLWLWILKIMKVIVHRKIFF